jgi:hypothetical protein
LCFPSSSRAHPAIFLDEIDQESTPSPPFAEEVADENAISLMPEPLHASTSDPDLLLNLSAADLPPSRH